MRHSHSGEVLFAAFLKPMEIIENTLARAISGPPRRVNEFVLAKRAISTEPAIRPARALGRSGQFRMGLQGDYDPEQARSAAAEAIRELRLLAA